MERIQEQQSPMAKHALDNDKSGRGYTGKTLAAPPFQLMASGTATQKSKQVSSSNGTAPIQRGGWKTKKVEKGIKREQKLASDSKLVDTAHHILPKKKLVDSYKKLSEDEQKQIGKDMTGTDKVMTDKQIMSLPFNMTLGPRPESRTDDPGDQFDPNYNESGSRTPRSKALEGAWSEDSGKIDPDKLRAALLVAKKAHETSPVINRSHWESDEDGKYSRQGAP